MIEHVVEVVDGLFDIAVQFGWTPYASQRSILETQPVTKVMHVTPIRIAPIQSTGDLRFTQSVLDLFVG